MIDVFKVIAAVLPGSSVTDLGWPAPGIHQYAIVVGQKKNPAYSPGATFNPAIDVLDMTKQPEFVPDVRILNLNGAEDQNAIVAKLTVIKKTLPENMELPKVDPTIASVNQQPLNKFYNIPTDPADAAYEAELRNIAASPVNNGIETPAVVQPSEMDKVNETLGSIVDALTMLGDRMNALEDRAEKKSKK